MSKDYSSDDDKDALDALELEAKEFDKVRRRKVIILCENSLTKFKDAEIDRILKAFRLDA